MLQKCWSGFILLDNSGCSSAPAGDPSPLETACRLRLTSCLGGRPISRRQGWEPQMPRPCSPARVRPAKREPRRDGSGLGLGSARVTLPREEPLEGWCGRAARPEHPGAVGRALRQHLASRKPEEFGSVVGHACHGSPRWVLLGQMAKCPQSGAVPQRARAAWP